MTPGAKQRLPQNREALDPRTLLFTTKINVFGLGLMVLWTAINTIVLPTRVADQTTASVEGSGLGLISFIGVWFAVLVQPLAGRASDAWTQSDPRRPFIIGGIVLIAPGLMLFGVATTFLALTLGFVLMQLATNVSQAAFQVFIPDHIEEEDPVIASGAKNMLSVIGAAVGLIGVSPTLVLLGVAAGFGAFQAVNWALLNDDLPKGQAATALGNANIATAGAGAITGIYGPMVDALNASLP